MQINALNCKFIRHPCAAMGLYPRNYYIGRQRLLVMGTKYYIRGLC
jgi:hypothetical protein